MKKVLSLLTALSVASTGFAAGDQKIISLDSLSIMQKSKEGVAVATEIQKKIENFQAKVKNSQNELIDLQSAFEKKMLVLSEEAKLAEREKIENTKRKLEQKLSIEEESLRKSIQAKQLALREKQLGVVANIYKNEPNLVVMDNRTPGFLFASSGLDQTDKVLKAVDDAYAAEKGAKKATKNVAKNDASKTAAKPAAHVKVA
ncbi:MAG: OmpH family outer membrane protein [Candidatus Babeliales bacterium]